MPQKFDLWQKQQGLGYDLFINHLYAYEYPFNRLTLRGVVAIAPITPSKEPEATDYRALNKVVLEAKQGTSWHTLSIILGAEEWADLRCDTSARDTIDKARLSERWEKMDNQQVLDELLTYFGVLHKAISE